MKYTDTIMQLLSFSLQCYARGICFYTSLATAQALRSVQRYNNVPKLSGTERTAMDQFVLVNDSTSNSCKDTKPAMSKKDKIRFSKAPIL